MVSSIFFSISILPEDVFRRMLTPTGLNKFHTQQKRQPKLPLSVSCRQDCSVQTLYVLGNGLDLRFAHFGCDITHHVGRIVVAVAAGKLLQRGFNILGVLTAQRRVGRRVDTQAVGAVAGCTGCYALVCHTGTPDLLTQLDLIGSSLTQLDLLACVERGDVSQILLVQVVQHTGHFRHGADTAFDFEHLLEQIFFTLPSQFREATYDVVTIGAVTGSTYGCLALACSCITCRMRDAGDTDAYQ